MSVIKWIFLSSNPRLARMLRYWGATCLIYIVGMGMMLVQAENGTAERAGALFGIRYAALGLVVCFVLVRASVALRIAPAQLAVLQGVFAISCNVIAYVVTGPVRGASMMVLLVVIVFCTFALRPRHTLLLCAIALLAMGATMAALTLGDPVRYPPQVEIMHFALAAISMISVTVLTGEMSKLRARLKTQKDELQAALATIRKLATVDELTALANRRHMNEVLVEEERRVRNSGQPTSVALIDLDFFKRYNDRYGHAAGDAVLRSFADAARGELRGADMLARWGGEEFLLLLPETDLAEAQMVIRRMAARVQEAAVPALAGGDHVTFSAGVTERQPMEPFAEAIGRADKALYGAKTSGRNCIYPL